MPNLRTNKVANVSISQRQVVIDIWPNLCSGIKSSLKRQLNFHPALSASRYWKVLLNSMFPISGHALFLELKDRPKNYRSSAKHGCILNTSPENSPIYLPVKTSNGIPLFLPLGRLDQCSKNQPAITKSSPDSYTFSMDASPKPLMRKGEQYIQKMSPPPHYNLSSPWQPVWKYNFPHLLMEDTQLERQFPLTDERKRIRPAKSGWGVGIISFWLSSPIHLFMRAVASTGVLFCLIILNKLRYCLNMK